MIIYGLQEELDALKDFFANLQKSELANITQVKFSDVKMIPLNKDLLNEMEKNIDTE